MSKEYIAAVLKKLRTNSGLTADEVGKIIGKSGKTVNAWENGRGQPDAEILIKLCSIYKVENILAEFDEENYIKKALEPITALEQELLCYFNKLNTNGQTEEIKRLKEMSQLNQYKKSSASQQNIG